MPATSQAHREETMITTEQEALKAVSKNGRNLKCVPEALRTPDVCAEAVRRRPKAMLWVPERVMLAHPEIATDAVRRDSGALPFVPLTRLASPAFCLSALDRRGREWTCFNLQNVPENARTPDVCAMAVRQEGWALKFVPERLKTPAVLAVAGEEE